MDEHLSFYVANHQQRQQVPYNSKSIYRMANMILCCQVQSNKVCNYYHSYSIHAHETKTRLYRAVLYMWRYSTSPYVMLQLRSGSAHLNTPRDVLYLLLNLLKDLRGLKLIKVICRLSAKSNSKYTEHMHGSTCLC